MASNLTAMNYTTGDVVSINSSVIFSCLPGMKFDNVSITEQVATCVSGGPDDSGWEVPDWDSCRTNEGQIIL